jgi:hypothetical protein
MSDVPKGWDPTEDEVSSEFAHGAPSGAGPTARVPLQPVGSGSATHRAGKTRNPWGVWLLSAVTFGIYGLWWYYTVNSELREFDDHINVQPGIALLACFFGITNLVSWVRTGGRIGQAQRYAGSEHRCSGLIGILLGIIGLSIVYYQSQINKIWDMYANPEPGTPVGTAST